MAKAAPTHLHDRKDQNDPHDADNEHADAACATAGSNMAAQTVADSKLTETKLTEPKLTEPKPADAKPAKDPRATPAMQQYERFKKMHPGCILLFRIGDFYEMFDEDAVAVSQAIGLTLTQRTAGVPMAGMPFHQLETYLRKLTDKGFRVAVCEQLMEASLAKGLVPRAVTRVITPGTLVDETLLDESSSATIAALSLPANALGNAPEPVALVGAAVCDVSTGEFVAFECGASSIADLLVRHSVKEVLVQDPTGGVAHVGTRAPAWLSTLLAPLGIATSPRPAWHFRSKDSLECITQHFGLRTLEALGMRDDEPCAIAAGALLRYVQETQTINPEEARAVQTQLAQQQVTATASSPLAGRRSDLRHLQPPRKLDNRSGLIIDTVSLRSLEVERTLRASAPMIVQPGANAGDGTLLGLFLSARPGHGACRTAMGKRLLREWLCSPLCDITQIRERQNVVEAFALEREQAQRVGELLTGVQDIARIAGRIALGRATPRDVVGLAQSLLRVVQLPEALQGSKAAKHVALLSQHVPQLRALAERVASMCVEQPPPHLREGGLVRDGVDPELDEARSLERDAGAWLADYQAKLIQQFNLPSLRVGYNKVAGYFIELPSAQARTAPPELRRTQTLRNAERFMTPELSDFERKASGAQARALDRERAIFLSLCDACHGLLSAITTAGHVVAALDCLLALADKAAVRGWTKPTIVSDAVLHIEQGRHPVLDELLQTSCVPNDCELGSSTRKESGSGHNTSARLALITGPNMAGKSTYIRQVALLTLLAHVGSFVPATSCTIGLTDRIFTRIGADDALHAGQSTFMVEMIETARILHHATQRSLVVLDEVGRGTSTLDGLSLAWAIVEKLAGESAENPGPRTLFATHYHELTDLAERHPKQVQNLHVAVREWPAGDDHAQIVFLHRILPGKTDQSYGLHVAKLAGMPAGVVQRAREVLDGLAVHGAEEPSQGDRKNNQLQEQRGKRRADTSRIAASSPQLGLFATTAYVPHPAIDALKQVSIESLSPMQAFDLLRGLVAQVRSEGPR
jgi:DNA mismatch repair protein MutS